MSEVNLKSLSLTELETLVAEMRQPLYRARQIFEWIYGKGVVRFDEMTNLPKSFREELAGRCRIVRAQAESLQESADGTVKSLVRLESGRHVETVLIPDVEGGKARRLTACVSSQVGCPMGCSFCATGLMGFQQNLTSGEIFDQARMMNQIAIERYGRSLTNIVFMGMGEPLLNYDSVVKAIRIISDPAGLDVAQRRITVSTVGLARRIRQLADESLSVSLAVSLHAPTDEKRSQIMPVNRAARTDLSALRGAIEYYTRQTSRPVTYEYCLFDGVNDTIEDAIALSRVARWAPSKVNLIMYNPVDGLPFRRTPEPSVEQFIKILVDRGVRVTVRRSRGQDIKAACGQLAVDEGSMAAGAASV